MTDFIEGRAGGTSPASAETQLLARAVLDFLTEAQEASAEKRMYLIGGLQAAWSKDRLTQLIGPDIEILVRLEYVRRVMVEYHGYHRLRGITVDLADFDGHPVRISGPRGIEVDRRAIDGIPSEDLRLAMLDAMLSVETASRRSSTTTPQTYPQGRTEETAS